MNIAIFSRRWWRATETPRWALVSGAICTAILGVLLNTCSTMYVENQKRIDSARAEQVRLLLTDLAQFQSAVAAFAEDIRSSKKASTASRSALIKNLNDQVSHAREIEELVPKEKAELDSLRRSINGLIEAIPDNDDHEAMKRFWAAAGEVTLYRNKLNRQLQRSI